MKKRTKEILSVLLAASLLLSTPAGMKAAEAAGQGRTDRGRMAVTRMDPQSDGHGGPDGESETDEIKEIKEKDTVPDVLAEESSEDRSRIISEESSEIPSEDRSQIISEELSEDRSQTISEESSEEPSEQSSAGMSQAIPEEQLGQSSEGTPEIESILKLSSEGFMEAGTDPEEWVELPAVMFSPEISEDGELDYRTYVDEAADLMIRVRKSEAEQDCLRRIKVRNSSLCDSDFHIELSGDGQTRQYGYTEWIGYLESCKGWVNGAIEVKLSDTGKKYFDSIHVKEQEAGSGKKTYLFWAEKSGIHASTLDVENGTRSYTAGRDTEAPVLEAFFMDGECYGPTMTDTEQYFAEDFVLGGTFRDDISGVGRIEYTVDIRPEENAVWTEVENTEKLADSAVHFQITLTDGCYPAMAVRAVDEAGNVSEVNPYVNDTGESIRVVVDSAAPVLKFDVSAGEQVYSGENDNWTNQDVHIRIRSGQDGCSYAGIGQCEYAYVKIGEKMTDVPEKWTKLSLQEDSLAELEVTEDVNGFYLFRAVSKAGVETTDYAKLRMLIQHQAAGIKPILVSGADEAKRRDGWYNKQSKTPTICFEYPDYDTGVISGEYDAPVTIHYQLARQDFVPDTLETGAAGETDGTEKTAVIGVMSDQDVATSVDGRKEYVLTADDLKQHTIDFGENDGFYTLKYWTTDKAGNESEKQIYHYKIDCHEPTDLTVELAGSAFEVGREAGITYQRFYSDTVSGRAKAQYGISQKGSLVIEKVKKIGEWKDMDGRHPGNQDTVSIAPNTRCFLYIRAEDAAGNVAEGWTNGIVVDNMAPGGSSKELIVTPEGANEHGFFNDDVTIDIRVRDEPGDDNCAALQLVTSSVGRDGTDTIAGQELFSFVKEAPTEAELIAASEFQGTQRIDAKANESNKAYIEVTATDRSGNTRTSTQLLKIDVTKPEIDIRFDNHDALNGNYYNSGRTAAVHVHEYNFDPDAVRVSVMRDGQTSETAQSGWTNDGSDHYAAFALTEDGEYSITAGCVDLADNASDEIQSETFVIDCTAPEMTIGLAAGGEAQPAEKEYFNTGVEAVITVTERNFRAEDFVVNMTPLSEKGTWSHEGDVHTLRIPFGEDNIYHIDCAYTDLAGNSADTVARDFVIDKTAPVILIDGVIDGSANSGVVRPVISVQDSNLERSDISVSVRTGIGDVVETAVGTALSTDENGVRYQLTLTDMTEKPDNVYYLQVAVSDLAGNKAERTCRFSLNRTGSVYDLTLLAHLMERQYNTYKTLGDLEIIEMNIDTVEEFGLYVSRNGELGYEAEYTREVSGSADIGYTYVYHIDKENFAREGVYRLTLYSRDRAGNEVSNVTDIHGSEITFIVDNTAPKVVIDGVEPGMVYDAEAREVHVIVTDNFKLEEAEFMLVNGENRVLESWDYMELAGENKLLDITVSQHGERVSLLYRVKDAAGNEMQTFPGGKGALSGFLVTTDKYIQLINSPLRASAGGFLVFVTGASGASAIAAAAACRRKRIRK